MSERQTECGSCCQLFSEGVLLQVTQDDWWCPSCVLEYANTQSRLRIELRRAIIAGGESPSEQYSSVDTLNLLRTRWMPVKEHNEKVRVLEQENASLRAELAVLRAAPRKLVEWRNNTTPEATEMKEGGDE